MTTSSLTPRVAQTLFYMSAPHGRGYRVLSARRKAGVGDNKSNVAPTRDAEGSRRVAQTLFCMSAPHGRG